MQNGSVTEEELVRVYTAASITDGYLARGRLEAEGIPVLLKSEGEGPYRTGPAYLWVPASLEVQARMILDEVEADGGLVELDDEALENEEP